MGVVDYYRSTHLLLLGFVCLLPVSKAGEFCGHEYCEHGCCDHGESECCTSIVGLIIGVCIAAAVTIFVIIIIICVCRRRRYAGHVYHSHPGGQTVIVQQGVPTTTGGVVNTAGIQPGVVYQSYQPYQPYPGMSVTPTGPPAYVAQPYGPPMYAQAPPSYESLGTNAASGALGNNYAGHDNPVYSSDQNDKV